MARSPGQGEDENGQTGRPSRTACARARRPADMRRMADTTERSLPTAVQLVFDAAARLGMEAELLDPEHRHLYEVRRGERRQVMLGGRSPLNDAVAARLAEDKHYTTLLLERAGVRSPRTVRCLSPRHPRLVKYRDQAGMQPGQRLAEELGFPVVVKPNRLSHARGVQIARDSVELSAAVEVAWDLDAIALVQEHIPGRDLRLDWLNGSYLAGYERVPMTLAGDGVRTIEALVEILDVRMGDPIRRNRLWSVPQIAARLAEGGWTASSVLPVGTTLTLAGPIRNLNIGCSPRIVEAVEPELEDFCLRAGAALGLVHFGVDLKLGEEGATVIEVNASPLLSQISLAGHRERAIVAQMRVLQAALG